MIPKIIHQTWKTDQVPSEWKAFSESWTFYHPDWEYKLWTDAEGAAFVEKFYPEFQDIYFSYPYGMQRADVIRYLLIYHYGGGYVDLDFECLRSFEILRDNNQLIIGHERYKHAREQSRQELLCNALIASQPGSLFLKAVIECLTTGNTQTPTYDVLNTTGPAILQKITYVSLDQYLAKGLLKIDFIKSDTQGHELEVQLGMTQVIERNKDHLCCLLEFSPGLLTAAKPDAVSCFIDFVDSYQTETYWINQKDGSYELVLMDKAAQLAERLQQNYISVNVGEQPYKAIYAN